MKVPCVYILASTRNGMLYTGVTAELGRRMQEHVQRLVEGFSKRYYVKLLVYYEVHSTLEIAIRREKRIKEWQRAWKARLIESFNPEWLDLFDRASGAIRPGPADGERQRR